EPVSVDVHVLASTNRNLEEMVADGTFRQDLFYRLNVIPLVLPPLRDRKADIPSLANHFLVKFSQNYGRDIKPFSGPVQQAFLLNKWLGNVREMENVIERAVLLSQGEMYQMADFWDDLPEEIAESGAVPAEVVWQTPSEQSADTHSPVNIHADDGSLVSLRDVERQMILHALQKTDNNRTHAAKMLGISVRTLRNKLHEYRNSGLLV
ncbi:MAG: sigma 54-interacting transcriptional regulator, partial [Spirochaetales bacterium]|nr:sigma 54-interacting transcriptional regulator [Spirochaetales bacterium]